MLMLGKDQNSFLIDRGIANWGKIYKSVKLHQVDL